MTNSILTFILVTTNWVNFSSDIHIETNVTQIHKYQLVMTNQYTYKLYMCSNLLSQVALGEGTNGVTCWTNPPALPQVPGQFTKP